MSLISSLQNPQEKASSFQNWHREKCLFWLKKKYILEFSTCPVDPGNARWHTARKKDRGNLEATWLLIVVIIWILSNVHHFHNQWPIWSSKVLWACTRWTSALLRSLGERAPGRLAHRDVHRHLREDQDQLEDFFKWCYSIRCKVSRDQVHLLQDRLLHIAHHCCSHQDGFYVRQQPRGRKYDFVDLDIFVRSEIEPGLQRSLFL